MFDDIDYEFNDAEEFTETDDFESVSPQQIAADYVRNFDGFEKCAGYVERHFEGDEYSPGDVIHISTRNQGLEGDDSLEGVTFSRKEIELADGLILEGVFPEFDSIYNAELGQDVNNMTLHQQFSACRDDFQEHLFDDREVLENFTFGDMERMDKPHGYAPEGWTWHHNSALGSFDLVKTDVHSSVGHTGSNSFSGK